MAPVLVGDDMPVRAYRDAAILVAQRANIAQKVLEIIDVPHAPQRISFLNSATLCESPEPESKKTGTRCPASFYFPNARCLAVNSSLRKYLYG